MLSSEIIQHISEKHLPLKCNKCSQVFKSINDFQMIGKCCSVKTVETGSVLEVISENMGDDIKKYNIKHDMNHKDEALTPLTKINLRWRRKSREFLQKSDDGVSAKNEEGQVKRQTSTPMQGSSESLSSMQFSSINCISSSSETDLSPPVPPKPIPQLVPLSPKSINKKKNLSPLSIGRTKMAVQNTPLRQVMTKSIQRAIVTHGHYKHVQLQQRKMTFDSSSSSNEPTVSLMKLEVETDEISCNNIQSRVGDDKDKPTETNRIEYEEIQVVLRRTESESSSLTEYKSCFSDPGTPKGSSSNILKKTISFDGAVAARVDETPRFLLSAQSFNRNDDDNDVFFTPRTTPMRRVRSLDLSDLKPRKNVQKPSSNIWNFVTSVMGSLVTATMNQQNTSASISKNNENNNKKWGFNLEGPFKAAASYFGKYSEKPNETEQSPDEEVEEEVSSFKRSRDNITSPIDDAENRTSAIKSPICKRRKIQGRKPIDRMRNLY